MIISKVGDKDLEFSVQLSRWEKVSFLLTPSLVGEWNYFLSLLVCGSFFSWWHTSHLLSQHINKCHFPAHMHPILKQLDFWPGKFGCWHNLRQWLPVRHGTSLLLSVGIGSFLAHHIACLQPHVLYVLFKKFLLVTNS